MLVSTPFFTSFTNTTYTRNDGGFWAGFQFRVGSTDLIITALGRYIMLGRTGSGVHPIALLDSGNNLLSQISLDTSTATPDTFEFDDLANPVYVKALQNYYVMSWEINNSGDLWWNDCQPYTTADATIQASVYANDFSVITPAQSGNHSFVPPSFKYAK